MVAAREFIYRTTYSAIARNVSTSTLAAALLAVPRDLDTESELGLVATLDHTVVVNTQTVQRITVYTASDPGTIIANPQVADFLVNLYTSTYSQALSTPVQFDGVTVTDFLPTDEGGLLWWASSDRGIVPVAGKVPLLVDQGPGGRDFGQPIGADQPLFVASGGGGDQPYLSSPAAATNVSLVCGAWASVPQPFELLMVLNSTAADVANTEVAIDFGAGANDDLLRVVAGPGFEMSSTLPGPAIVLVDGADFIVDAQYNGVPSSIAKDGAVPVAGNAGAAATGVGATLLNRVALGKSHHGRWYAGVAYDHLLSPGVRTDLLRYLGGKYGIAVP